MTLLTILGMAIVTYATRAGGYWLLGRRRLGPRMTAALSAVPPAVLTAVIAPALLAGGIADIAAGAIVVVTAARLPMIAAVVIGVAAVAVLRQFL